MPWPKGTRALVLHNAKARQGEQALVPVRERLAAGGLLVTVEPFESLPEIARDVTRLHQTADIIVVCGGDGSISSAAPAVIESGLPLGIIPAGTANDLARTLSIPLDFAAAADAIVESHSRRIDVGMVNGQGSRCPCPCRRTNRPVGESHRRVGIPRDRAKRRRNRGLCHRR